MISLQQRFAETSDFLLGVEPVSTRGPVFEECAIKTRRFAAELAGADYIDWVSITDNAGGTPMPAPAALGKPILTCVFDGHIVLPNGDVDRTGL